MAEQALSSRKRLQAKDLITVGIFTAIYIVVMFAVAMLGIIPTVCGNGPAVELAGVSFAYSRHSGEDCLHNINLAVAMGECVLLCGLSGCGKTTLTRIINGLIPHYYEGSLSGNITVAGKDMARIPIDLTAGLVGSVFQNPRSQFFTVDVTSEIAFGCENIGLPKAEILERVANTSHEMGLDSLMNRSIFELSGGEKQKVACASVAALRPDVLVLDEPSSNLDMRAVADLRWQITKWKRQGKAIIIAEHRLFYLQGIVDRAVYLTDGAIAQVYTWAELEALSPAQLEERGLRTTSLRRLLNAEVGKDGQKTPPTAGASQAAGATFITALSLAARPPQDR